MLCRNKEIKEQLNVLLIWLKTSLYESSEGPHALPIAISFVAKELSVENSSVPKTLFYLGNSKLRKECVA